MNKDKLKDTINDIFQQIAALQRPDLSAAQQEKANKKIGKSIDDLEKSSDASLTTQINKLRKQFKAVGDHLARGEAKHDIVNASLARVTALSQKDQGRVDDLMRAALKEHQEEKKWTDNINQRKAALQSSNIKTPTSTKNPPTASKPHSIEGKIPRVDDLEKILAQSKLQDKINLSSTKPLNQGTVRQSSAVGVATKPISKGPVSAREALASIKELQSQIKKENAISKGLLSDYNKKGISSQKRETITGQLKQSREKLTAVFKQLIAPLEKLKSSPEHTVRATKQLEKVNNFLEKEEQIKLLINKSKVIKPIIPPSPAIKEVQIKAQSLAPVADTIVGGSRDHTQAQEDSEGADLLQRFEKLKSPEAPAVEPEKRSAQAKEDREGAEDSEGAYLLRRFERLKSPEPAAVEPEKRSAQAKEDREGANLLRRFEKLKSPEAPAVELEKSSAQAKKDGEGADLLQRFEKLKSAESPAVKLEKSGTQSAEAQDTFKQRLSKITDDAKSVESKKPAIDSDGLEEEEDHGNRP